MKLVEWHNAFLRNTVNLSKEKLDLLEARTDSIYAVLAEDDDFATTVEGYLRQGSWAHRTIIEPVRGKDFDADILLQLEERQDWAADPKQYVLATLAALNRSDYKGQVEKHTRCVRVVYDDSHVDVVPYIECEDGDRVIVDSAANKFEDSSPAGFADWMAEKDALAKGNLRKAIRLVKYLRDFKVNFSVPSVILTALVGERVRLWDADTWYKDVPTALNTLMGDLDQYLQMYESKPSIPDPSCPTVTFDHRWDQAKYANFRDKVHLYAGWIKDAYEATDHDTSVTLWQNVFGPDFKSPGATDQIAEAIAKAGAAVARPLGIQPIADEEFIESRFPRMVRYSATISATVKRRPGFRSGPLRSMKSVGLSRSLLFEVATNTPWPYEIYWKVRNTGKEATDAADLRGKLEPGTSTKTETTSYRGHHYVEAYIVKGGQVVAADHHRVRIE